MAESETDKSFSQTAMQQFAQKRVHTNDAAIVQREREINDIAQGIIELADIFKDLQTMVIDQGTMLDRIDYNVERMAVDVKGAEQELTVVSSPKLCPTVAGLAGPPQPRRHIDAVADSATGYELPEENHPPKNHSLTPSRRCGTHYWSQYQDISKKRHLEILIPIVSCGALR